jgi:hypothetical protein
MATVGDRYLLTLRAHSLDNSQSIQNVFAYELTVGPGGAHTAAVAFATNIMPAIEAVISVQTFYDDVVVINLDDPTDYETFVISGTGALTGESMPTFCTWAFEYIRTDRTVNNGRKSFGLLAESSANSGRPTSGTETNLFTLADALAAELQEVSGPSRWEPKIFRRPGTYLSGTVAAPGQFFDVSDVVYRSLSTQNTRKTGRGS